MSILRASGRDDGAVASEKCQKGSYLGRPLPFSGPKVMADLPPHHSRMMATVLKLEFPP